MFCYQKNFSNPTLPVDEAQFWALVKATKWNENIDKYRETGDAALKRKLPAFIFQATFDETTSAKGRLGAWRKQAATRLTGLVVMDLDHIENPLTLYQGWIDKGLDLKALGIVLIYITPSGKGLKIVFKARLDWGNLIDNQHAMAKLLGDEVVVDEACKDSSRMNYICKNTDILYIDKELFTYENKEYAERYTALYRDGRSQSESAHDEAPSTAILHSNEPVMWRGYDVQCIVDKRYGDKLPCREDRNRHNESLKLASDLLTLLDGDRVDVQRVLEKQMWVQELISEGERVENTISSAVEHKRDKEKKFLNQLPSKPMLEAIQEVTGKTYQEITKGEKASTAALKDDTIAQMLWEWGEEIEALSEYYPALKDVCKGLKHNQYPAALFVAGGLMMTLMTRCTYRFYHRPEELRRLNNSTLIIGDPASGKSFATRLFKLLAAPIIEADKIGKEAINTYREQMRTKGANKEKPKKPKVIVRVHPARTSNAQFIQDMVNSVEEVDGEPMQLHMLTFDTEAGR